MASIANKYMTEMAHQFRHRPTWPAQRRLTVGMFGKLNNGKFEQHGTLADFDLALEVSEDEQEGDEEFKSSKSTSITIKAKGDASQAIPGVSAANAGIHVAFGGEQAIVFQGKDIKVKTLTNLRKLRRPLLELYENGILDHDDVIINEVYEAATCTILASLGKNASITLEANADIGAGQAKLADAEAGFEVVSEKAVGIKVIAASAITPLFNVVGLKRSFFGGSKIKSKGITTAEEDEEELYEPVVFDPEAFARELKEDT